MNQQTQKTDPGETLRASMVHNSGTCRHLEAKKALGTGSDSFRMMADASLRLDMEALQRDIAVCGRDAVAKHLGESILRAVAA